MNFAVTHRFYCPQLVESGFVNLADSEAHHLVHVLRHQVNEIVELFSGDGLVASSRIVAVRKRDVELEIINSKRILPSKQQLTIATAVPKGDRFDWLIEKLTELGATRLLPMTTSRSVVDPRSSKLEKLRQTVITACKQSGRNHLMEIASVKSFRDLIKDDAVNHQILVGHPEGIPMDSILPEIERISRPLLVMIGPEGGFSTEEIQDAMTHGGKTIQLVENILRIETAAIAFAAKLLL